MPKRQLGATKYIRLGLIPISLGIFLELSGSATADFTVSSYCYWLQIVKIYNSLCFHSFSSHKLDTLKSDKVHWNNYIYV